MHVASLTTLGFRNLADGEIEIGPGVTVLHGPNGAGKTNALEALFFALTGRSCRTRREREAIGFGQSLARAEARLVADGTGPGEALRMMASVSTTEGRRRRVDGRDALPDDDRRRPAISLFMPDRLALVKGPPSPRRAHLDRLAAALWPARASHASEYRRTLGQRNALLQRIRSGAPAASLDSWDAELAAKAVALVDTRTKASEQLASIFPSSASALGLGESAELRYRPRTGELDREEIESELATRRESDLSRGLTGFGPHLDELEILREGRAVRRYGSQGQQRVSLLALLFAERDALLEARRILPLMLLDDVTSELDLDRRGMLAGMLSRGGQAVVTTTDGDQFPLDSASSHEVAGGVVGPPAAKA